MAAPVRDICKPPHWTAPERIAFYLFCLLTFGPLIAYMADWQLHISSVFFNEACIGIHLLGLVGMLGWCLIYLRSDPFFARAGLAVTLLLLAGWAYILLI